MKNFIAIIQRAIGTTASETAILLFVVSITIIGTMCAQLLPTSGNHELVAAERVAYILDSLFAQQLPTLTGGDSVASHQEVNHLGDGKASYESHSRQASKQFFGKVNINKASLVQLQSIRGVGPATAQRIVEQRSRRPFRSVDDLLDVKGIGEKKLSAMRPFVSVQ
jgi:competence ComEA-like helix-hairpin-helix protein